MDKNLSYFRKQMVTICCLGLAGAVIFIILFWVLSSSLTDIETPFVGLFFILILAGISLLAHKGKISLAAWILTILLSFLVSADLLAYGVTTPSGGVFVIPILLSAFCLGRWVSIGIACLGIATSWLSAWLHTNGPFAQPAADISQITFNAPILTIILVLTTWLVVAWVQLSQPLIPPEYKH